MKNAKWVHVKNIGLIPVINREDAPEIHDWAGRIEENEVNYYFTTDGFHRTYFAMK
jgi:hypothetical protein